MYGKEESGKTSLLKTICGLLPVKKGKVLRDGIDITNNSPEERDFALLHEDGGFFERKTVEYNLSYPLIVRKQPNDVIHQKLSEVESKFFLTTIISKKIRDLSIEERIKVSFARLFMREAKLYLLDDPFKFSAERDKLFQQYFPCIKSLSEKAPVIYATSDIREVVELQTETVILHYGVFLQKGSIESIRKQPACLFTYQLFHPDWKTSVGTIIRKERNKIVLSMQNSFYELNKEKLLNDIYIGSEVLVCSENGKNIKIFDKNCERLIYFAEMD